MESWNKKPRLDCQNSVLPYMSIDLIMVIAWLTILLKALNTPMLSLMWLHKATHDCLWIRKFCSCTCEADLSLYLYNKCTNTIIWVTENHVLFKNPILYQYIYSWFSDFWKNGIYVYIYLLTPMIYRLQHIYRIVWIHRHVF